MERHWGNEVTVVVHHIPEDEDFEGGYEAVTMVGVPHGVIVTGEGRDSADDARAAQPVPGPQ